MTTYDEWLFARSCASCQDGGPLDACAVDVWVDSEKVRCTRWAADVGAKTANESLVIPQATEGRE